MKQFHKSRILAPAKCGHCGKEFYPAPYHAYKIGAKLYCTWSCLNNYRNGKVRKKSKVAERNIEMAKLYKTGATIAEVADEYNLSPTSAREAIIRGMNLLEGKVQQ